jgi:hypothetical protein
VVYSTDWDCDVNILTAETGNIPQLVLADAEYRHPLRHLQKRATCWAKIHAREEEPALMGLTLADPCSASVNQTGEVWNRGIKTIH